MRKKAIPITDERVKLMSEIITAIKLVKMYAWEKSFAKKINGKYNSPQLYYSITHLSHLVHCGLGLVLVLQGAKLYQLKTSVICIFIPSNHLLLGIPCFLFPCTFILATILIPPSLSCLRA